jgi:hypothetical protein
MKWPELPLNPTPRMLRQFSAAWLIVFLALAVRLGLVHGHVAAGIAAGMTALIGVAGLFRPARVRWVFIGATVVAFPIGWVVTQLVLALMFYLVLTPLALVFRWRGRDALQLRRPPGRTSFWITRGPPPDAGKYLKQY